MNYQKIFSLILVSSLCLFGEYRIKVYVNYPFASERLKRDTVVVDSAAVGTYVGVKLYGETDKTIEGEEIVGQIGFANFKFESWKDGSYLKPEKVSRIDISFPRAYTVEKISGIIQKTPVSFKNIQFKGTQDEKIKVVLPSRTVHSPLERSIGKIGSNSVLSFKFITIQDTHIGQGFDDFGTYGYYDDTIAGQSNAQLQNVTAVINDINTKPGIDFVVVNGDIAQSAEVSEFWKARAIFSNLNKEFYIPVFGNHDTYPYTENNPNYPSYIYDVVGIAYYEPENQWNLPVGNFKFVYDNLNHKPVPNLHFMSGFGSPFETSYIYKSYYFNLSFDYQRVHFLVMDFHSNHKAFNHKGCEPDAETNEGGGYNWDYSLEFFGDIFNNLEDSRSAVVLCHHPLNDFAPMDFNSDEIHDLANNGLYEYGIDGQNRVWGWFAGHRHRNKHYIKTCEGAALTHVYETGPTYEGWYSIVSVYDHGRADIDVSPEEPAKGQPIEFQSDFVYNSNYPPSLYHWDFGDNTQSNDTNPVHIYNQTRKYKAQLTVTNNAGKSSQQQRL